MKSFKREESSDDSIQALSYNTADHSINPIARQYPSIPIAMLK